jgi:hypothetical protein
MVGTTSGQTAASKQGSFTDQLDYDSLGAYAPETEVEEKLLDLAIKYFEKANEFDQQYWAKAQNPYGDIEEMLELYGELYLETGQALDPELFQDLWSTGRQSLEDLKSMRDMYMELAESTLEDYAELKEDKEDTKRKLLNWLGAKEFEFDSEQGSAAQQLTIEDILNDFFEN